MRPEEVQVIQFTHRSVPEFLIQHIQESSSNNFVDDAVTTEAIFYTLLGESIHDVDFAPSSTWGRIRIALRILRGDINCSDPGALLFVILDNLDSSISRAMERIDLSFPQTNARVSEGEGTITHHFCCNSRVGMGCAIRSCYGSFTTMAAEFGLHPFLAWELAHGARLLGDRSSQYAALWGVVWSTWNYNWVEPAKAPGETLRTLLEANTLFDVSLRRGVHDFDSLSRNASLAEEESQLAMWGPSPAVGPISRVYTYLTPWNECLVCYLRDLVLRPILQSVPLPKSIEDRWKVLGVWLEFGAQLPFDINLGLTGSGLGGMGLGGWGMTYKVLSNYTGRALTFSWVPKWADHWGSTVATKFEAKKHIIPIAMMGGGLSFFDVIRYWKPHNEVELLEMAERNRRRAESLRGL